MTGYTPEQMPVLSALARGFATFDHWFCEVPSQTFTNRSFFHAASSSGFVVNVPVRDFPLHNDAETLFDRLDAARPDLAGLLRPAVALLADRADPRPPAARAVRHQLLLDRPFFADAEQRRTADLLLHRAADHRPRPQRLSPRRSDAVVPGLIGDPPSSIIGGEDLLARIYNAIRSASSTAPARTAQHPVHGRLRRARRHLRPRPAARAPPARPGRTRRADGLPLRPLRHPHPDARHLRLDPRDAPSSTTTYRNTSLIRTLRERWNLGPPLTARDATPPTSPRPHPRPPRAPRRTGPRSPRAPVPAMPGRSSRWTSRSRRSANTCSARPSRSTPCSPATYPTSTPRPQPANKPTTT